MAVLLLIMPNINDSYFDGYYKDLWRTIIPEELTQKEVDFMMSHFNLQPGNRVLDLMCGYGRHAIALASKGMAVTAVDNLEYYIQEINAKAANEKLSLKAVKSDILKWDDNEKYDLVICMGNSLNFFNAEDIGKLFSKIASWLKPGGHLLINSWSIAEIAIRNFKEKLSSQVGEYKFIVDSKYLFQPSRIESEHLIIAPDGKTETKTGIDYIYSISDLEEKLKETGMSLEEVYSIPGRKKFIVGEPRAYLVARKA